MQINKEQINDLNIVVTIEVTKDDYHTKVCDVLRDYRRKAHIPGFRPGKVPEGVIRKMYGKAVLVDELNKLVAETLQNYIKEQELKLLGDPMPNMQDDLEWEIGNDFTFEFELGLSPVIDANLTKDDKLTKYRIMVDREMIDKEMDTFTLRFGKMVDVEKVEDFTERLNGDIVQVNQDRLITPDGLLAEDTYISMLPIKEEEYKKPFENAKTGDEIVFHLSNTFPNKYEISNILKKNNIDEVGDISDAMFRFTVKSIMRYQRAEKNQELFDKLFAPGEVSNIEEFENKIKEYLEWELEQECLSKFIYDVRQYLKERVNPPLPEEYLYKRLIRGNKETDEEQLQKHFPQFLTSMKWQVISNAIISQYELKVDENDIMDYAKTLARRQFSRYGMHVPSERQLQEFAMSFLKEEKDIRELMSLSMDKKIALTALELADVTIQDISLVDFNNLAPDEPEEEPEMDEEETEIMEEPEMAEEPELIEEPEMAEEESEIVEESEKDEEPEKIE